MTEEIASSGIEKVFPFLCHLRIMPPGDLSRFKEKMMKVRITLVCTLLLLAAVPTFALPLCGHCNLWNQCESAPGDFERCKYDMSGNCITTWERCSIPRSDSTVLADWKVVSIETSSVATECVTDAAPAAEASTPAPQTTELSN